MKWPVIIDFIKSWFGQWSEYYELMNRLTNKIKECELDDFDVVLNFRKGENHAIKG